MTVRDPRRPHLRIRFYPVADPARPPCACRAELAELEAARARLDELELAAAELRAELERRGAELERRIRRVP